MKLTLVLLLFLWDNVEFTLTYEEISCPKPLLENFEVEGDKAVYKKDDFLRYFCNPGYIKVDGRPSQCKKVGQSSQWTPMPRCEPITCRLSSIPPEGTIYNPHNQIRFRLNETVTVSCGEKYFVKSTELSSAVLTCQDTGDWDFEPVCRLVTCFRNVEHVYNWERTMFNTVSMDQTLSYRCHQGFVQTSPRATCTRRGWEPNPLCEEISCPKPPLDNFEVEGEKAVYKKDEFLRYSCNPGYRKVDGRPSQCQTVGRSTQWTPMPRCEPVTCRLSFVPPEGTIHHPQNQIIFRSGETVTVSCGEKYFVKSTELSSAVLTCQDTGDWDFEPVCRPVTCFKNAEHVYNWERTMFNTVSMDQTLSYHCHQGFVQTSPRATCTRRGWEPNTLCEAISCPKPPLDNFEVEGEKAVYNKDEFLRYSCNPGYRKVDGRPSQCKTVGQSSQWTPMPQCEPITCRLSSIPPEGTIYNPHNQIRFTLNETVTVSCGEKYFVKSTELSSAILTCQDTADWDFEPVCKPVTCLKNAEHVYNWERTMFNTVSMDQTLTYRCHQGFVQTSPRATCTRRGWEPNPLCKGPCTLNSDLMQPNKIRFRYGASDKLYIQHDEVISFECIEGATHDGNIAMQQICNNGEMALPRCV